MNWRNVLNRLEGAYAPSTIRSYSIDFEQFGVWCRRKRLAALPAKPETIAIYIDALAPTTAVSSIKRKISAIKKVHRLAGHPGTAEDESVLLALRRAKRSRPGRPRQVLGLTYERRCALLSVCSDDLAGLRDKVLVAVGFDTLCRRAELVSLRAEDLADNETGTLSVLVRRAKNDPEGMGRLAHLSPETASLVRQWLERAQINRGPLLRPVYKGISRSRFLDPSAVARILKRLSNQAFDGQTAARVSGHSLRVGAAQSLTSRGVGLLPIMTAGGWKSTAIVARYVENVDLNLWV